MALADRIPPPASPPGKAGNFRPLLDKRQASKGGISLEDSSWEKNSQLLVQAIDSGLAVMLSRTQDGGAISMTAYLGQERYRTYCATAEDIDSAFEALARLTKASGM